MELAKDTASTEDVIWHTMNYIDQIKNKKYDALMMLVRYAEQDSRESRG